MYEPLCWNFGLLVELMSWKSKKAIKGRLKRASQLHLSLGGEHTPYYFRQENRRFGQFFSLPLEMRYTNIRKMVKRWISPTKSDLFWSRYLRCMITKRALWEGGKSQLDCYPSCLIRRTSSSCVSDPSPKKLLVTGTSKQRDSTPEEYLYAYDQHCTSGGSYKMVAPGDR